MSSVAVSIYRADGSARGPYVLAPEDIALNVGDGERVVLGHYDPETTYLAAINDPEPTLRPSLAAPTSPQVAPGIIALPALPAGSVVTVTDEEGLSATFADLSEPLMLPDAGVYRVAVAPPFPWLAAAWTLQVTGA